LSSARALLEHGLSGLALWDISFAHAAEEIEALRTDFPSVEIITAVCDVRDEKSVGEAAEKSVVSFCFCFLCASYVSYVFYFDYFSFGR
jgi:sorbose reductase